MSQGLSNACDYLLSSTSILSHKYGVINYNLQIQEEELISLEAEYFNTYQQLVSKLDHLDYLHVLSELKYQHEEDIDTRYNEICDKFLLIEKDNLLKFLESQRDSVKTESLLTNYIQIILPTLRSVHHSDLTLTESKTLKDLDSLYSVADGTIYRNIKEFKVSQSNIVQLQALKIELNNLLTSDLKTSLSKLNNVEIDLEKIRLQVYKNQKTDITILNNSELMSGIKEKLVTLIKHWDELLIICDLLPSLIIALNVDWYQMEDLFNAITDSERIKERIQKFRAIINKDLLTNSSFEEILMINFHELD